MSGRKTTADPAGEAFRQGLAVVKGHPLFADLATHASIIRRKDQDWPYDPKSWAVTQSDGTIRYHPRRQAAADEWAYVLAHALLHLGLGHFRRNPADPAWSVACCAHVARMLDGLGLGQRPADIAVPPETTGRDEESLCQRLAREGMDGDWRHLGLAGAGPDCQVVPQPRYRRPEDWPAHLARGLREAARRAVDVAGGRLADLSASPGKMSQAESERRWFIDAFPLLGAAAAGMRLVEDPVACRSLDVSIAAVVPSTAEILINPAGGLSAAEMRFVVAHEILHAALRHDIRGQGRDPYLFNVACDFAINGWLVALGVGVSPVGVLIDPTLDGKSAEEIYDLITTDLRRFRKLRTLRGQLPDVLPGRPGGLGPCGAADLDTFYRRALAEGMEVHIQRGRGTLPAALVEEIRALAQPPIPWDVRLGRWFDDHFEPVDPLRDWHRPPRRQQAAPQIPMAGRRRQPREDLGQVLGVVLDSSGSMDRVLLGKALGAIVSYCVAKDVTALRLVFCDAAAYDAGWVDPAALAHQVRITGRGGTVLQPGIDLLLSRKDFPRDAPLLVITDGLCDALSIPREHALLVPEGAVLPFRATGPVFRMK